MKLIGCDRCRTVFPASQSHSELRVFDDIRETFGLDATHQKKELCSDCRADLARWFDGHQNVLHEVVDELARPPEPTPDVPESPTLSRPSPQMPDRRCEICGRVGKQRFVETDTGWRCSPTAVKCRGHRNASDIAAKPFPNNVTPVDSAPVVNEPDHAKPTPFPAGITARCQDCTRSWNLTGVVLRSAVEMHELKHGHIVTVVEDGTDEAVTA